MSSTVFTVGPSVTCTSGTYRWTFHVEKNHDRHMSKRLPMFQFSYIFLSFFTSLGPRSTLIYMYFILYLLALLQWFYIKHILKRMACSSPHTTLWACAVFNQSEMPNSHISSFSHFWLYLFCLLLKCKNSLHSTFIKLLYHFFYLVTVHAGVWQLGVRLPSTLL